MNGICIEFQEVDEKFIHKAHFHFAVLISFLQDFQLWPGGPNFSQHQRVCNLEKNYHIIPLLTS